ncbi:alpha/beta hydrolase [Lacticaseibacillus daqingensis]|uniref:alpha/beta hydrolase n=1 Tax=Lacticaseibacillus daqingensis TaxID=2486014 RepID=UPI000F7850E5|nr:alpha/beta hydrolase [Lacticaseibacillus daqingensis]
MKKRTKLLFILFAVLALLGLGGHIALRAQAHPATPAAAQVAATAAAVGDTRVFGPKRAKLTVVVYPGAFVDPAAYSLWAQRVAAAGYRVAIVSFPYDLAVLGGNRADTVVKAGQRYVIGGHSLGGVMASRYAAAHPQGLAGVFFLASYPDAKGKLTDVPALSLMGSRDGVLSWSAWRKAKANLPAATTFAQLTGGNHAGFGAYGGQKGDRAATVSNAAQQKWVAAQLTRWLVTLK